MGLRLGESKIILWEYVQCKLSDGCDPIAAGLCSN